MTRFRARLSQIRLGLRFLFTSASEVAGTEHAEDLHIRECRGFCATGPFDERAVRLSKAIESDPNAAVSLLAEEGLTPEQWSKMLDDIARDPVLAAAHEAGMK